MRRSHRPKPTSNLEPNCTYVNKPLQTALNLTLEKQHLPWKIREEDMQTQFNMMDETRVVATLPKDFACPTCGSNAVLWRFVELYPERKGFQVYCSTHGPFGMAGYCTQSPIPESPIADPKQAVQAWRVMCALVKRD